ncbi:MAG: DUF4091 domain-containing protein [Lachnospiraceae bacterium]|nr:DUF4091 domain-containing protein [Lachnospiraceae bacterium]
MNLTVKQISSLEKIRQTDALPAEELLTKTVLLGERFSYQICIRPNENTGAGLITKITVDSPLKDNIQVYIVKDAVMDKPVTDADLQLEDYITHTPGFMPDILVPIEEQNNSFTIGDLTRTLWVRIDVPTNAGGIFADAPVPVTVTFDAYTDRSPEPVYTFAKTMLLDILPVQIPEQKLLYTRWFYADCIATQHHVDVFSEAHWELLDKYIASAADLGINMLLVPVHTPPLDTAIGTRRPCVQLVDITKDGDTYSFGFEKFHRFIALCKKNGIRYYEIAHMFSQWGAKCAPNILVTQNGKAEWLFGWHVAANSPEYTAFLKQYIAAIYAELNKVGIAEYTYFHVSDEPNPQTMDSYKAASDLFRPLIGSSKTLDALSSYLIYEKGLVECPVTSVAHIHEFLEHPVTNQWAYYCCGPQQIYTNSFMAMPSYRTRILGFLLYKYDIKGFLHWGYNFYNSCISWYPINPYLTTSGDGAYPSGDPFIVYPAANGTYQSIRGQVTYDALQDMRVCCALEEKIGRSAVIELIDKAAGMDLRFDCYPHNKEFIENLRTQLTNLLR